MINNNTCKTQLLGQKSLNEAKERVAPFLNPKIVYNEGSQKYEFQNACAVPQDSANYFDIGDGCFMKTKEDLYNPGSKGTENIYMESLEGRSYPGGCGINIDDHFDETVDEMSYSLDYDFIEQIYKLEKERDALKHEIDGLNRSIYERRRYIDGLIRGVRIANERLKTIRDWFDKTANDPVFRDYNEAKKKYMDAAAAYNQKVDQVVSYVKKINEEMRGAVLFSECGFSGRTKTIKMNSTDQWSDWIKMDDFRNVKSMKVVPGMRVWLWSLFGGYFWGAKYISGKRDWGYDGDCMNNVFNDNTMIARLERLDNFPAVEYRKVKSNPEAGKFINWDDVFQD